MRRFRPGTSRVIDLGYARVRASRITYVGELGWELYVGSDFAQGVYDEIVAAGQSHELKHTGYHAMNSLRLEKAYRHWGHDITEGDTAFRGGRLDSPPDWSKQGWGLSGGTLYCNKSSPVSTGELVQFMLEREDRYLYHDEPIWRDGRLVGRTTSGMFGHTLGRPLAMGYVER